MESHNFGFACPQTFTPDSDSGNLQEHIAIQATAIVVSKFIETSTTPLNENQVESLIRKVKAAFR